MPALLNNLKRKIDIVPITIFLSFIIWMVVFRKFLSGYLSLSGDAMPYFDHFKYFIDNLMRGVYPLWDPFIIDGIPNEFYLRRIGSFNPLYVLMILFRLAGFAFEKSYLLFLALYYWLGLIGFYLLSLKIFKDRMCALISYLLLMFSSMSTVIFSSFLMLSVVPIIWFFYFLWSFFEGFKRSDLLGFIFCLMITVTTYLPFYFLHNFLLWLICLIIIFPIKTLQHSRQLFSFIWNHKVLSILCICSVLISFSPGYLFFQEMATGEYIMPVRHKDTDALNTLIVAPQTYLDGGIMATRFVDEQFTYFDKFILGRFYIPILFCVFLLLGLIIRLNKRIVFLLCWSFLALVSGVYEASPIYQFLYDHVGYIKYMRNFQYFLWINLIPVLILLSVENLRLFIKEDALKYVTQKQKTIFISIIHLALIIFFVMNKSVFIIPLSLMLSFVFFYICINHDQLKQKKWVWGIILLAIVLHPIQVYHYLQKNSERKTHLYNYETIGPHNFIFSIPKIAPPFKEYSESELQQILINKERPFSNWFSIKATYNFHKFIVPQAIEKITRLELFDQVERIDYANMDHEYIARAFLNHKNSAFIDTNDFQHEFEKSQGVQSNIQTSKKIILSQTSPELAIKTFQPNTLEIELNLPKNKFFVFRDSFEKRWEVFVDGKREVLYKANLAFKGLWVPSGKHTITLKYADSWYFYFQLAVLCFFYLFFCIFVAVTIKDRWLRKIKE